MMIIIEALREKYNRTAQVMTANTTLDVDLHKKHESKLVAIIDTIKVVEAGRLISIPVDNGEQPHLDSERRTFNAMEGGASE